VTILVFESSYLYLFIGRQTIKKVGPSIKQHTQKITEKKRIAKY